MSSAPPVQSIDRLFDVIEILSQSPEGMQLNEIASSTALNVSTAHRLLAALISRGYAQKDAYAGKYRLTMRFFEIGSSVVGSMDLVSAARPLLESLAGYTKETVHLVSRCEDEVIYLYKEDMGNSSIRMASLVGSRAPMYCTAVGKSILAYLPEPEARSLWSRTKVTAFTPTTCTTFADLQADLAKTRERGYAVDNEEHEVGVYCIAAPVFDYSQKPIASLSVSFPAFRVNEDRRLLFAEKVTSTGRAITRLLGGSPAAASLR